jgi:lipid II:glycine glycyltransferase (peptidoglycan interpeptide bridge formation enzyme)
VLASLDGRTVAGSLLIEFAGTVSYKMGGWSGDRTVGGANAAREHAGMVWAQRHGARWYDLEGIATEIGVAVSRGEELPDSARRGVGRFKLTLGGQVELLPGALDIAPNPVLRPAVRLAAPRAHRLQHMAHRVAGRGV